ncbi:MAG: site-2 protease family protein [Acidobacteriia bacterium]|nr:site-2 protease family protein [Terriglobia bacterium]
MGSIQNIDIASVIIQFAVLLFSLSIHEASHAWMADRCGDYTARYLGRVTLNPIAHMDPLGTFLFPLLQMIMGVPLIGWAKPVPVNSVHLRNPHRDQILVSLAGPGANLVAAGASFALLAVLKIASPAANGVIINMIVSDRIPRQHSALVPLLGVLFFTFVINLALALFNVIPIPPLDGHWILYELLPYNAGKALARVSSYGFVILYLLMFLGAFRFIFWPISQLCGLLLSL